MADAEMSWLDANQRYLVAALDVVRARLSRTAAGEAGEAVADQALTEAESRLAEAEAAMAEPPALAVLTEAFVLSPFERELVVLCAGPELDGSFGEVLAAAHGDPGRRYPTFGLALATLVEPTWSALAPGEALRAWQLVELGPGGGLSSRPLRLDERILHFVAGLSDRDERLRGLLQPMEAATLAPSQAEVAWRVSQLWTSDVSSRPPVVMVCGTDPSGRRSVAAAAVGSAGFAPYAMQASDVPTSPSERETLARLWEREVLLEPAALVLELDDVDSPGELRPALALVDRLRTPVILSAREPVPMRHRTAVRVDVDRPTRSEQQDVWRHALGEQAGEANGALERLTAQFDFGVAAILAVGDEVQAGVDPDPAASGLEQRLWQACRVQARPRLAELATRLEPKATWDDIVLPEGQRCVLREIAAHVRRRHTVYEDWGFRARSSRGLGISALFSGISGTGKTMGAEVLANELRLDLYHIDLSAVVSKYIGETEKNLRRVFDAAEGGGAILLFDEADALFGKRSDVKDSHDRYANIEVSYLLQRMESYRGLAILTTNMKDALDDAFMRRIRFLVHFPFPDTSQRAEIWRRVLPPQVPTDGLDLGALAGLNVAGGNIRNIALYAAFLAADAGGAVGLEHLLRAARVEYAKLDRPLTEAELRGLR